MSKTRVHSKGCLIAHIILVTKYRKKILSGKIEKSVKAKIENICKKEGCAIFAIECDKDHIHILLEYPKHKSISYIVQKIKQETTYYTRKEFIGLSKIYYKKSVLWSDGYFANSVGDVSIEKAKYYIERQG